MMTPEHSQEIEGYLARVENICRVRLGFLESDLHGLEHLREVAHLAGEIAAVEGADVEAAVVGGFLHDCGRQDDRGGNAHALVSAELASQILAEYFPHLPQEPIVEAIRRHADGEVSSDALEGAIWDADRLTIGRAGIEPKLEYFSTATGRAMAKRVLDGLRKQK